MRIINRILIMKKDNYNPTYLYIKLWGRRTQQPRPTSYRAQGPCRGGRNARKWTKRVQVAKRHRQGQSCPQPTKIVRRKSGMPLKTASQGVLSKKNKHGGPAMRAWRRNNFKRNYHLRIKCPQLTIWSH